MGSAAFAFAAANRVSAGAMARVSRSQIPGFLQNDGGSRPDFAFERQMIAHYGTPVAGIDEAGRGPWAGPVVAAAVCLDPALPCPAGVNDSKQLSEAARARLFDQIAAIALSWGVGEASAEEIAALNIRQATHLAMRRALDAASAGQSAPKAVLVDGNDAPELPVPARAIVKGDARSLSIAAASIIAKVTRDRIMAEADARHPGYGFAQHKGYGTAQHAEALERLGPCPLHRMTFAPVAARLLR